MTDLYRPYAIM